MTSNPFEEETNNHSYIIIRPNRQVAHVSHAAKQLMGIEKDDVIANVPNTIFSYLSHALSLFELCPNGDPYIGTFNHEMNGTQEMFDLEIDHLVVEDAPLYIIRLRNRNWMDSINRISRSLNLANVGLIELDGALNCRYVNEGWETLAGQGLAESKGRGWTYCFPDQERVDNLQEIFQVPGYERSKEFTAKIISPIGQILHTRWFLQFDRDARNRIRGITAMVFDITEEILKSRQAEELAHYDSLTGLLNRTFFSGQLRSMVNLYLRSGDLALMYLDLDGFKEVNDNYGHQAGDKILVQVAQRLKKILRKGDVIARLGGDEFAVLALNLKDYKNNCEAISKAILNELNRPFYLQLQGEAALVRLSASIGIAGLKSELTEFSKSDDADVIIQQLMSHADLAMYEAKKDGKSKAHFYNQSLDNRSKRDSAIRTQLYECLDKRELELEYQPIIEHSTGCCVGSEALLRWKNRGCGNVSVQLLIKMLESSALCIDFGREVVAQSLRQLLRIERDDQILNDHYISINLSPLQIRDPEFVGWCLDEIERLEIPGELIQFEVTESIFLDATGPVKANLRSLRERGIRIALDDFGTGYSSLSYLEHFPIDCIKIDKSMVAKVSTRKGRAVVRAVLQMSDELSIRTIAEGVETSHQLDTLSELGADLVQGFYYSKSLERHEHIEFIKNLQISSEEQRPELAQPV